VLGCGLLQGQRSDLHWQGPVTGVLAQEEWLGRSESTSVVSRESQYCALILKLSGWLRIHSR